MWQKINTKLKNLLKRKKDKTRKLSESLCKDALKILREIVDADVSLHIWLDRGLGFGQGSLFDAQLGKLTRVVASRI